MLISALRLLPHRVHQGLYRRFLHPLPEKYSYLCEAAPLKYAPGVTMRLLRSDTFHGGIALFGYYERDLSKRVVAVARRGGLMVDVGANAGYFSLLWASQRSDNRCVAVEASPRIAGMLRENVGRNGFGERIRVLEAAAGKVAGRMPFDVGPKTQTGWGGLSILPHERTVTVPLVRLDDEVEEDVALLKVDVEGAETWVLMGAERLLRTKRIREIHFEHNKVRARRLGIGDDEPRKYLESSGYAVQAKGDESADMVEYIARVA